MHAFLAPRCAMLSLALVASLGIAGSVLADSVDIESLGEASTEQLGSFAGSLDYSPNGDGTGTLVVSLTNTSPAGNGGFITGFLFNVDCDDPHIAITLEPGSSHPFTFASGSGEPFGSAFMAGAALGGSFLGGGNPNAGIAVGATGTFTFKVVTEQADDLGAADFVAGPYEHNFVVRFRGFEDGGSDKVPAALPLPPVEFCPCDYNFDGVVDAGDMGMILAAWGPAVDSPYDTNGDGLVDGADFGIFLLCWRQCGAQFAP